MTDTLDPPVLGDDDAPDEPTPIRRGFSTSGNGRGHYLTPKRYRGKVAGMNPDRPISAGEADVLDRCDDFDAGDDYATGFERAGDPAGMFALDAADVAAKLAASRPTNPHDHTALMYPAPYPQPSTDPVLTVAHDLLGLLAKHDPRLHVFWCHADRARTLGRADAWAETLRQATVYGFELARTKAHL